MKKKLIVRDDINVSVPKWPGLLVSGESVDSDIAAEILIRTDYGLPDYSYRINDRDFADMIADLFGLNIRNPNDQEFFNRIRSLEQRLNMLPLNYLMNKRIASSYIGGPHGWCDWSGNIFCNNYNIGKHPSVKDVTNDWLEIAAAFPMLKLRSQLLSEGHGDTGIPLVEYIVDSGTVTICKPLSKMFPMALDVVHNMMMIDTPYRERGVNIEVLKMKLEHLYGEIPQYE